MHVCQRTSGGKRCLARHFFHSGTLTERRSKLSFCNHKIIFIIVIIIYTYRKNELLWSQKSLSWPWLHHLITIILYQSLSLSEPQFPLIKWEDEVTNNLWGHLHLKKFMSLLPWKGKGINMYWVSIRTNTLKSLIILTIQIGKLILEKLITCTRSQRW